MIGSGVAGAMAAIGVKVLDLTAVEALATGRQVSLRGSTAHRPGLELLSDAAPVVIVDLTAAGARSAGLLAAAAGAIEPHPALVHTVAVALERSWPVVTRDPDAALTVSAAVRTETIP